MMHGNTNTKFYYIIVWIFYFRQRQDVFTFSPQCPDRLWWLHTYLLTYLLYLLTYSM